ncbi:hypothetical protein CDL15_Pgr000477 [Punica granatum]|uniref:Late embryogenesis abundant protein LEA-2 subgroup domain-containing protein n=2 Tax=Punica granatum TaxID=22663 RepID=A0A218W2N0_PUNGR|nr:hypothetical protein CDL15_Pgr000477 [Punica granatum]
MRDIKRTAQRPTVSRSFNQIPTGPRGRHLPASISSSSLPNFTPSPPVIPPSSLLTAHLLLLRVEISLFLSLGPPKIAMNVEKEKLPEGREAARRRRRRRATICCGATLAVIIGIVLLIVILAFTVYKPKRPVTTVNGVSLKDLDVSLDVLRLRVNLNVTLDVALSVENPNKVGFRYKNSSARLNYRGQLVGEAPLPADKISAGETKAMNLTLTLLADRFLSNSQAYGDVIAGELPLNTYTKISGKVTLMNIFRIHVVSTTTCDLTLLVSNRTVGNQHCKYKTKL